MASDSHTIASLKTIKICQSKFSGSRVSEQLRFCHGLRPKSIGIPIVKILDNQDAKYPRRSFRV